MIENIQKELESLSARKIELQSELLRGDVAVSSARESLLQGRVGAVQTVTVAHSSAEALRASVMALDERIAKKRTELADAELEAARIETFEHRLQIVRRGEELLKTYLDVRDRTNEALKKHAEEMSVAFYALQDNRNKFLASIDVNDATFGFDEFIAAGAVPTAVRAQWDGTKRSASDIPYIMPHVQPFEDILRLVFHVWNETKKGSSQPGSVA